jgi:UDP-glucose 4-epimerase
MASHYQLCGRKVLVTGATGFIGSHLCRELSKNGAEVHAVSRAQYLDDRLHWWQADLSDIGAVRALLRTIRPEIIFHLSGHVTATPDLTFVLSTFNSHVVSTVYLLTAATEVGCERIVLTASMTEPQLSSADATPGSPYGAAKWVSSAYGRMFHGLYQTPVTIVRPFVAYGPMQSPQKIIPYVTLSLLRGESPKLASGRWQADWIYIDDVIEGCLAAAYVANVEGCTIDLGSGVLVSTRDVVDHIVKLIGAPIKPSFGALADRPSEEIRVADLAYAEGKIGWKPTISIEEGLARTVSWYQELLTVAPRVEQKEDLR